MNQELNKQLITVIYNSHRLTALTLRALGLRLIMLIELEDFRDHEQDFELEEIRTFFDDQGLVVTEHEDGSISFSPPTTLAPVIPMKKPPIPDYVVVEFIGGVDLNDNSIQAAEEIASVSYESMEALIGVVRGYAKDSNRFGIYVKQCQQQDLYKPYFKGPVK